ALTSKDWLGGALTQLDALTRPTAEDIKLNFAWVAPFVKFSPDKETKPRKRRHEEVVAEDLEPQYKKEKYEVDDDMDSAAEFHEPSPVEDAPSPAEAPAEDALLLQWESPPYGHGGFPREVVVEMCIALMQHLSAEGSKITKKPYLADYMDHCEWAFEKYGLKATYWLSTEEHIQRWEERYMANNHNRLIPKKELEDCQFAKLFNRLEEFKGASPPPPEGLRKKLSELAIESAMRGAPSGQVELVKRKLSFADHEESCLDSPLKKALKSSEESTGKNLGGPTAKGVKNAKGEAEGATATYAPAHIFQTFDLKELGVPSAAWPRAPGKGKFGYTLTSCNGAAIEVLCKARAFVIKRVGQEPQPGPEASKGQLTWAKCESVAAAREQAKQRANWPY
ncbi:unnamed protein product, partial [Durusdinium trenchii]